MLSNQSERIHYIDKIFDTDIVEQQSSNFLLIRCIAKKRKFSNVDFKYTIFDTCYFRLCSFKDCNFTGCRFSGSNLLGSTFLNCKFDYAVFEKTQITPEILDTNCPSWENLKLKFARSLRMNFQSLGDCESVNKAISLELNAAESHLKKAWSSPESYYRSKYRDMERVRVFFQWFFFKTLDFIWGNGESVWKLLRAVSLVLGGMAFVHVLIFGDPSKVAEYKEAFCTMPLVFLGVYRPPLYPDNYLAIILLTRLIAFGLFMAIIIKRLNRR